MLQTEMENMAKVENMPVKYQSLSSFVKDGILNSTKIGMLMWLLEKVCISKLFCRVFR